MKSSATMPLTHLPSDAAEDLVSSYAHLLSSVFNSGSKARETGLSQESEVPIYASAERDPSDRLSESSLTEVGSCGGAHSLADASISKTPDKTSRCTSSDVKGVTTFNERDSNENEKFHADLQSASGIHFSAQYVEERETLATKPGTELSNLSEICTLTNTRQSPLRKSRAKTPPSSPVLLETGSSKVVGKALSSSLPGAELCCDPAEQRGQCESSSIEDLLTETKPAVPARLFVKMPSSQSDGDPLAVDPLPNYGLHDVVPHVQPSDTPYANTSHAYVFLSRQNAETASKAKLKHDYCYPNIEINGASSSRGGRDENRSDIPALHPRETRRDVLAAIHTNRGEGSVGKIWIPHSQANQPMLPLSPRNQARGLAISESSGRRQGRSFDNIQLILEDEPRAPLSPWSRDRSSVPLVSQSRRASVFQTPTTYSSTYDSRYPPLPTRVVTPRPRRWIGCCATPRRSFFRRKCGRSQRTASADQVLRCAYCGICYTPAENYHGVCQARRDRVDECLKAASCVRNAGRLVDSCAGSADEDVEIEAIRRTTGEERLDSEGVPPATGGSGRRKARAVARTLVCLIVPCLWCFVPARSCHSRCKRSRRSGPRHKAVQSDARA